LKSTNQKRTCVNCQQEFDLPGGAVCPNDGGILAVNREDPLLGTILDNRYEILEVLGGGGMGVVYKARQTLMKRIVAIKMLHKHVVGSGDALKRFQLEAQASGCLSLPNILTVYDFGVTSEGQPYMVMDYLDGFSLADLLTKEDHLSVERSINIFVQACTALAHAHEKGVLHRDLKPSNIMLVNFENQRDFVKIVDFGIAKLLTQQSSADAEQLTKTGEVFGSPLYMSPEQCRGKALDVRSDVYSIGCVMYKTLTGYPVFAGDELIELLFHQMSDMPAAFKVICPQLKIPAELEKIVFKSLAKEPEKRYQTMQELREALRALQKQITNTAEPTLPPMMEGLRQNAFMDALSIAAANSALESATAAPSGPPPTIVPIPANGSPPSDSPAEKTVKTTAATLPANRASRPTPPASPPASAPATPPPPVRSREIITSATRSYEPSNLKAIVGVIAAVAFIVIGFVLFWQNMQNANRSTFNRELFSSRIARAQKNYNNGQYVLSVSDSSDGIAEAKKLGPSDPELSQALALRAGAYLADRKYDKSAQDYNEALALAKSIYGDKTLPVAELKTALSGLMITTGQFAQAEPLLQQSLAVEQALQATDLDIADTSFKLATAHTHLNKIPEAIEESKRALTLETKLLPTNNPKLLATKQLVQSLAIKAPAPAPTPSPALTTAPIPPSAEKPEKPEKPEAPKQHARRHTAPAHHAAAPAAPVVHRHAYSTWGH
jgi:serine/threonine protein kinase